jgi:lactoylglutathione lyase
MAKAIHAMIRVLDEQRSVEFYKKSFGLDVSSRLDFPTFTLVYLRNAENDFEIELTINKDRTEPYSQGEAYGHIAFVVDDLASEHARFQGLALNPLEIKEFKPDGKLIARFFFVQDPDGFKIEVLERHGHYQ